MTIKLHVSGNLGPDAKLAIHDEIGNKTFFARRRLRINIGSMYSDLYLEYYGSTISKLRLLIILSKEILNCVFLYPKILLPYLFYRYEFKIDISQTKFSNSVLNFSQNTDVWYSRSAGLNNLFGDEIGFMNDINKFRFASRNRVFVLCAKDIDSKSINLKNRVEKHIESHTFPTSITFHDNEKQINLLKLNNAEIFSPSYVISNNEIYVTSKFDTSTHIGWPTSQIYLSKQRISSVRHLKKIYYETGVMNNFSNNWYHFLVECLPSLILNADSIEGLPFLHFGDIPKQIFQIIDTITKVAPVQLPSNATIEIKKLYLLQDLRFKERFNFNERGDDITLIKSFFGTEANLKSSGYVKKVYIARESNLFRRNINEIDLQELLVRMGFEIVFPERISFREQIELFRSTTLLISQTGAGLTNMLFMKPESKVIELKFGNYGENFWANFAFANNLIYVPFQMSVNKFTGLSKVDTSKLKELISSS